MKYGNGKYGQHSYGASPSVETHGEQARSTNQYIFVRKYRDINKKTPRAYLTAIRLNVIQENILNAIEQASADGFETPEFTVTKYTDGDLRFNETALNTLYTVVKSLWSNYSSLDPAIKLVEANKPDFEDFNEIEKALYLIIRKGTVN